MRIPIYQIDAFTDSLFGGNPAAVCPLDAWLPDERMQAIAAENNLSETAFFVPAGDGADYDLRWFTPTLEIDLAGHPTLATAFLIFTRLDPSRQRIRFRTKLGDVLVVTREDDLIVMDFPARPAVSRDPCPGLVEALGAGTPEAVMAAERDYLVIYGSENTIRALEPDIAGLADADRLGIIVTAPGHECDFVSRFFAPRAGIAEDPVTGSAHCTLVPYWAGRLARTELRARQVSPRGGELFCRVRGERVGIAGRAVLYLEGSITLP